MIVVLHRKVAVRLLMEQHDPPELAQFGEGVEVVGGRVPELAEVDLLRQIGQGRRTRPIEVGQEPPPVTLYPIDLQDGRHRAAGSPTGSSACCWS
jgi:hypothetical protein